MDPMMLSEVRELATTGYGMFGFYDEDGDHPAPEYSPGWLSATSGEVHVRPRCQLPSPGVRFELWTDGPPRDVTDQGDEPEVQALLKFHVTGGSIGLMAMAAGAEPGVFELPPGWYRLHLLGYRRSTMAAVEENLYARDIAPGDDEWERAEGTELYVARFWPAHDAELVVREEGGTEPPERIETIRAWARSKGLNVRDHGPIPAAIIAMYDADR